MLAWGVEQVHGGRVHGGFHLRRGEARRAREHGTFTLLVLDECAERVDRGWRRTLGKGRAGLNRALDTAC